MNELREPDLPRTGKQCVGEAPRPGRITGPGAVAAEFVLARNTRSTVEAVGLAGITTRAKSGKPASAARVGEADTARRVYELWDNAGVPFVRAEAFHEQGMRALTRYVRVERGVEGSVRAAPVEFTGLVRVGANAGWGEEIGDARYG